MGDDQHAGAVPGRDAVHALGDDADGVDIEAAVGLVEDGECRPEHGQLQDLGPLLLAAGESFVQVAPGELLVDPQLVHLLAQFLAEVAHRDQVFAFLARRVADVGHRVPQEVGHRDAGDGRRVLEARKIPALARSSGSSRQDVLAVERDRAFGDLIIRVSHQGVAQGALPRAVGAHQGMDFSLAERQVHPAQDFLALDRHVQILDRKNLAHQRATSCPLTLSCRTDRLG